MGLPGLLAELRRRRVFRALVAYGLVAFGVLQVIEPVMHGLHWPEATLGYVVVGLAAGFPFVAAIAWAFDLGPRGVERTPPVESGPRGLKLAAALVGLGLAAAAPGLLWYFWPREERWLVPIGPNPRLRGPPDAPVTVVEFGDFQCPFTRLAEPALRDLARKYPDKLRVVWRDYPLGVHPDADDAAQLALEALRQKGPDGFWKAHDRLLLSPRLGRTDLERLAIELGLDAGEVRSALETDRHRVAIDHDVQDFARLGKGATPTFFVNGRWVEGEDPESLERAVVQALAESRRLAASGVPPERLYDEAQRGARAHGERPARVTLPAPGRRPARGGPAGRAVDVNEFCDLSSARCAWLEPALRRTLARYGDEVRLVWWDVSDLQQPESRRVRLAAQAARATPDGFWAMHDAILASIANDFWAAHAAIMANTAGHPYTPPAERLALPTLREYAQRAGVDLASFDYQMAVDDGRPPDDPEVKEARALGLSAGSIVVDGEVLSGSDAPWVLRSAIDRALARRH